MDVNNAERTLTVVLEHHLVQVVLMARFPLLDLHLKQIANMVDLGKESISSDYFMFDLVV